MMTKFEVSKKYRYGDYSVSSAEYTCEAIVKDWAIVTWNQGTAIFPIPKVSWGSYEEIKPLTFADLKPGEKFKWVVRRDSGDVVCMKLGGPMGKSLWIAIPTGFCFRDDANNEVVRVP